MTENQSVEGVAFELMKWISQIETAQSADEVLSLYAECLGVVKGDAPGVVKLTLEEAAKAVASRRG